jgi:hypothetical protein
MSKKENIIFMEENFMGDWITASSRTALKAKKINYFLFGDWCEPHMIWVVLLLGGPLVFAVLGLIFNW